MKTFVVKGNLCFSRSMDELVCMEHSYIVVEDGRATGIFRTLPERYAQLPVLDYEDRLVLPGMTDLHIHAPQFAFRGLGMDMELLEWLNTYTFPEESKYKELEYADRAYSSFVEHLLHSTTTRAAIFATIHVPATKLLMQKLDEAGLSGYVGKVNMNRNSPVYLREISTNQALRDTESWLCETKEAYRNVKPILTPRFIPSCTDDLMYGLARLQAKYGVPVQSHLSENYSEIAWIRELCPRSKHYGDAYEQFGLFGGGYPCIMAHCVHSNEDEQALMKKNGVFIAHSPESNMNLASGVAPINKFLDNGLRVGLATDVAGGSHESMLRAMTHAIQASKLRWRLYDQEVKPLPFERAFYLATMGGDRQELHERIRELSMIAGKHVKEEGRDNDLLDLIAADEMFHLTKEELEKTMDPSKYTGRASVQVDAFLKNVVNPVLEANKESLGMTAEINV